MLNKVNPRYRVTVGNKQYFTNKYKDAFDRSTIDKAFNKKVELLDTKTNLAVIFENMNLEKAV